MGLVKKSDYLYAKLLDKTQEVDEQLIELDDKEIIRLGLESQDILTVSIDHIEWANTESLETYQGTKATLPKINIYWDDETITQASINYTMIDNVSYYLEAGNYELRAVYRNFTSTNTLPITVIEKILIGIEWENTNPITTQQNHRAYLPYIKLNYNDGKFKRLSSQSPGVTLSDSEYYLELGEKTLTATYKEFTTNELTINVIEEEIIPSIGPEEPDEYPNEDYLTLEALEDGEFSFAYDVNYQYNNENWINLPANIIIDNVHKGDIIKIKYIHKSTLYEETSYNETSYDRFINKSPKFNVYGSLNKSKIYNYSGLFGHCINLVNAKYLILSNSSHCGGMFQDCTSLIAAPELHATTLEDGCYAGMFSGCTSLTTAPELPATTLADSCYANMFSGCTSLTTAPELPATTLAGKCYDNMFAGCTSLTAAPELPATTLAGKCYLDMFNGCTSLVNAPELPATTLEDGCYAGMFSGCTSLITAPELPATILATNCYVGMFSGCTALTTAPELPATTLAGQCYHQMFEGCASLTVAPELPATTLAGQCYNQMFKGCASLTVAPELPATTLEDGCYAGMFSGCTSLITAPELPATTLNWYCYASMFQECTSLTTAPELPATALKPYCYDEMFRGCTSLNNIKAMITIQPDQPYANGWVSGVAATGTFVKYNGIYLAPGMIPEKWTVQEINIHGEIVNEYINE